jgi:hypothetical protein
VVILWVNCTTPLEIASCKNPKNNKHLNAYANNFSTRLLHITQQMFNIINVCQKHNNPSCLVARTTKLCAVNTNIFIKIITVFFLAPISVCQYTCTEFQGPVTSEDSTSTQNFGSSTRELFRVCILAHRIWRWLPHLQENLCLWYMQ